MLKLLPFLILLLTGNIFAQSNSSNEKGKKNHKLFQKSVPKFSGTSLNNIEWNNEKIKGKVVLLNFWFIGCPPCMKEIALLNLLKKKYQEEDFVLLSIAPQLREDLLLFNDSNGSNTFSNLRKIMHSEVIEYEIIPVCTTRKYSPKGNDTLIGAECDAMTRDFLVDGFPSNFFIDKKGMIRKIKTGFVIGESGISEAVLKEYENTIELLLKEK